MEDSIHTPRIRTHIIISPNTPNPTSIIKTPRQIITPSIATLPSSFTPVIRHPVRILTDAFQGGFRRAFCDGSVVCSAGAVVEDLKQVVGVAGSEACGVVVHVGIPGAGCEGHFFFLFLLFFDGYGAG